VQGGRIALPEASDAVEELLFVAGRPELVLGTDDQVGLGVKTGDVPQAVVVLGAEIGQSGLHAGGQDFQVGHLVDLFFLKLKNEARVPGRRKGKPS